MKQSIIYRSVLFGLSLLGVYFIQFKFNVTPWVFLSVPALFFLLFKDFNGPYAVVLMFHSVSDRHELYPWPAQVCHIELFERFLAMVNKAGFHCLDIDDFYRYKEGSLKLSRKSVLLTFDDGNLDNWVFAAPLLKKHQLSGVIFVSEDFIEKSDCIRARFDDVGYDPKRASELESLNYCSEKELQLLDKEGVLRVEAHAKSHSFYFSSDKLIGFYKQTEENPFLEWNANLEEKPFWMTKLIRRAPLGSPIFEFQPSCGNERRYIPDERAQQDIAHYIQEVSGGKENYKPEFVYEILKKYPGRYETDQERKERFEAELIGVKRWLENLLQRKIEYMVWPHGGVSRPGLELARKHYKLFQNPNGCIQNKPSDPIQEMNRIGGLGLRGTMLQQFFMLLELRSKMEVACGNYYWVIPFAFIKVLEKMRFDIKASFDLPEHYKYDFKLIHE